MNMHNNRDQYNPHNEFAVMYYLHNTYGLGDSVFNIILFKLIEKHIIENNILIYYFVKPDYIYQLSQFINNGLIKHIKIYSLDKKPHCSIELWINNPWFGCTFSNAKRNSQNMLDYNDFYLNFFNHVLHKLSINASIRHSILYSDNDLPSRINQIPDKYKSVDILILNSQPCSWQYNYNKSVWDRHITHLNSEFKIVTTTKVNDDVLCTFDEPLSIKDIAALSTCAKVIIAINSGVLPGLLNVHTMASVKQFYIFDNECYYSFPGFQNKSCITQINRDELCEHVKNTHVTC